MLASCREVYGTRGFISEEVVARKSAVPKHGVVHRRIAD
jgi:hypothetical protein